MAEMRQEDPDELADELEAQADRLEDQSHELEQQVEHVREDWDRKRGDESVPGATPPAQGEGHGQRNDS